MFLSAYETTPCKDYVVDKIALTIKKQRIVHPSGFDYVKTPVTDKVISGCMFVNPTVPEVPPFAHPFLVYEDDKSFGIYADVRNFTRIGREQNIVVSSRLDYDLTVLRMWLQRVWAYYSPMDLLGLGTYPITVYSRWMTEQITKRLALPPDVQMRVSILTAYFYICMFYDGGNAEEAQPFDEKELLKVAGLISKATYINANEVMNTIDGLPVCRNVYDLVKSLIDKGGSLRFEEFNAGLVYSIISGSWFGQNHRELVAVAVEHPPTFMAILAKAVNERGYHNTIIGKIAKLADKGDIAKTYVQNILNLPTD